MKRLTRANIAHDLSISPHFLEITYPNGIQVIYYFSSEFYRNNFQDRLNGNRDTINQSLSNRFGFEITVNILADVKLYTMIEKRGFRLVINGKVAEWPESITLDGNNLTVKS